MRPRPPTAPAVALFAAALAVAGGLLVRYHSRLTFWRDEWDFLLHRNDWSADAILSPHIEHVAVLHTSLYSALLHLFGMDSPRPFQLVAIAGFLLSVVLLFVYLRRRVGDWLALAGALPILVLGPAWDDLLWPFQVAFFGSMCFGLGALLALEREHRRGDRLACALLTGSMFTSSLGIPFALGVGAHVLLGPDRRRRAFLVAVPLGLFGLWYLGFGRDAESSVSLHNLVTAPSYVFDGFASSLSSLLGLASPRDETTVSALDWGRPLFAAAVMLGALRLRALGWPPRWLTVALVIAVGFWALAALNASIFREPTSGRYQYMGAIFCLLIAAELLRGVRLGRPALAVVLVVFGAAALSNLNYLNRVAQSLTQFGENQPAGLAAIELTRDRVAPDFLLTTENSDVDYLGWLDAGSYLAAADEFGSPAYTPPELLAASEPARAAADKVFAAALELELEGRRGGARTGTSSARSEEGCIELQPLAGSGAAEPTTLELRRAEVRIIAASDRGASLRLRRYASEAYPVELGELEPGESASLAIPSDLSDEPWELELEALRGAELCRVEPR